MLTWQAPVRSSAAQAVYAAAEQDRAENPDRYRLDADAIVERACARLDVSPDDFAEGWQSGLAAFVDSVRQDARLNAVGIRMARQTAIGRLSAGAHIAGFLRAHPEVADRPIAPPIVIIGGWRTGTTFLYRLLGTDPQLHAPLPAELVAPWRFATPGQTLDLETTSAATQMLHTLNPEMAIVHPSGPTLPEECVLAMGTDLRNWGFTSMMRLPSYARWLAGQNLCASYARYREVLQLLSRRDSRRLVLKAPAHTAELDHLVETFPGATVVQIHRDIVETLASGASLFALYRCSYSDDVDAVEVGREQVDQSELWFRRATKFRASAAAADATFVDLDYTDLVADPVAAVGRVYQAAGVPPPELPDLVAAYHRTRPRDAGGRHRYTPQQFGIDPEAIRSRFLFLDDGH